jgi:hypothetical protein
MLLNTLGLNWTQIGNHSICNKETRKRLKRLKGNNELLVCKKLAESIPYHLKDATANRGLPILSEKNLEI